MNVFLYLKIIIKIVIDVIKIFCTLITYNPFSPWLFQHQPFLIHQESNMPKEGIFLGLACPFKFTTYIHVAEKIFVH